jgi:lantibiotic modifying enzyme
MTGSRRGLLAAAVAWGDELLARSPRPPVDAAALGYGHGPAGVAAALARLAARTGMPRFAAAADDALAALAAVAAGVRHGAAVDADGRGAGWAAGAAGVALALADAVDSRRGGASPAAAAAWDDDLAAWAHRAADAASPSPATPALCWEEHARLDALLSAADALSRPALCGVARARAAAALARARRRGSHTARPFEEPCLPGVARGLAGAGYALLRAARPERVPSLFRLVAPAVAPARGASPMEPRL